MGKRTPEERTVSKQDDAPPFWPPPPGWWQTDWAEDANQLPQRGAQAPASTPVDWGRKATATRTVLRRVMQGTLIGIAAVVALIVVVVVVAVIGLIHDLDKGYSSPPLPPRSQQIPLRRAANLGVGWSLKVLPTSPSAERAATDAEKAHPLPTGTRYFVINLAATYTGHRKGDPGALLGLGIEAVGAHGGTYDGEVNGACLKYVPRPMFGRSGELLRGQTARGYICFEIEASDARTLLLHTGDFSSLSRIGMKGLRNRWFALH
jgi:hypothetical protein